MALYSIDEAGGSLHRIPETTLSGEGKQERHDLQRWLRDHPTVLEDGLFVLAEEYGEWAESGRRIDLLALDRGGRLVVVELKRDEGAFMDLQALRYAAMVAHMTFERAVAAHEHYLRVRGIDGEARERIIEHLASGDGGEPEIESANPRILLAARDFPRELTTSVLWLRDRNVDIRCVRLLPYRVDGTLVLDVTPVIPLPEAGDYLVRVRDKVNESERRTYPVVAWTASDIERLVRILEAPAEVSARAASVPHPRVGAVIDVLADEPDAWISIATTGERSGETQYQIRGLLARFTRIVRIDFERDNWPFEVESRSSDPEEGPVAHYRMTAQTAACWRAARAQRSTPVARRVSGVARASEDGGPRRATAAHARGVD